MSESAYCDFCEMELAYCIHGNPQAGKANEVAEEDKPVLGPIVVAKFKGECAGCGEAILVGDHIGAEEFGHGGEWYHYGCGR